MSKDNQLRIGNRSDGLAVLEAAIRAMKADGGLGVIETPCGDGSLYDCLEVLQDALERDII
jgi:hypothetical protein